MKTYIVVFIFVIGSVLSNTLLAQDKALTPEDRIYSLSLIWRELRYTFAFPEKLQKINLDSLYKVYLPRIEQSTNNYDYYRTLSAFMAHFDEAHTRIYAYHRPDDVPPLKTINFGKTIIVSNVAKKMADKIPIGSEITKINHIPVVEYITDSVYPYISAATQHWKFDKSVSEMLYGRPQSTVIITVKNSKGKERDVVMIRNYNSNGTNERMIDTTLVPPITLKIIEGQFGYIQLTSFVGQYLSTINSLFNGYLPQLRKCKGLIIDIRGNRGGTDEAWENIADHLISGSQFSGHGKWFSRKYVPTYQMWGENDTQFKDYYEGTAMEEIKSSPYLNPIDDSLKLHQPLIIISGQYVGSASEDFLEVMKNNGRGKIVGEPSVGCVGEPMFIPLPGDLMAMICAKKYISPDGSQPNETGILPDIEIVRDYQAYQNGEDNMLERAIEELRKQLAI
jgi:carboxyl-terminal processing protease